MPLHCSSFLTTDCHEDHQATLLERGTYFLALFTNLKQKLQFCKHFVNGVCKNSLFGYCFICTLRQTNQLGSMSLLAVETIAKNTTKHKRPPSDF